MAYYAENPTPVDGGSIDLSATQLDYSFPIGYSYSYSYDIELYIWDFVVLDWVKIAQGYWDIPPCILATDLNIQSGQEWACWWNVGFYIDPTQSTYNYRWRVQLRSQPWGSYWTFELPLVSPPGKATNPTPADDEEKVSKGLTKLEWDAP